MQIVWEIHKINKMTTSVIGRNLQNVAIKQWLKNHLAF